MTVLHDSARPAVRKIKNNKRWISMRIVVLDGFTENPGDLSWGPFEKFGEVVVYDNGVTPLMDDRYIEKQ